MTLKLFLYTLVPSEIQSVILRGNYFQFPTVLVFLFMRWKPNSYLIFIVLSLSCLISCIELNWSKIRNVRWRNEMRKRHDIFFIILSCWCFDFSTRPRKYFGGLCGFPRSVIFWTVGHVPTNSRINERNLDRFRGVCQK